MKQGYSTGVVLLGFIFVHIQVAECINCLNCKNIADLSTCQDVTTCREDEVCFIDKTLSGETFQTLYNTGCKSVKYCTLEYCNKKSYGDGNSRRRRQSRPGEALTLCSECCFEDTCNTKGCGYIHHPNNVSQCYSCNEVYDGGPPCTKTEDCDLKLFACSVTLTENTDHRRAYDLGCKHKRRQCDLFLELNKDQVDENVKCCDEPLCNRNPYYKKVNKTAIAMNFSCPAGIARPTTTPVTATALPATKPTLPPQTSATAKHTTVSPPHPPTKPAVNQTTVSPPHPPTKPAVNQTTVSPPHPPTKPTVNQTTTTTLPPSTTTTIPTSPPSNSTITSTIASTMATNASTTTTTTTQKVTTVPATTKPPTTKVTTLATTTTTKVAATTKPPPKTLPPVTRTCAVCAGPLFLCEKLFAPTPCPSPNNYCINTITNHKDGTKNVVRACGNFDTCYREWFQGSSDNDKCRKFTGNDEQRLDFQCTFCCVEDNCNTPLHPADNTLYKPA